MSKNTKISLHEKVRRGIYPSIAPLGYLNDKNAKTIVVDKQFAGVIREVYETHSSGRHTLREISLLLKKRGAITCGGKPYSLDKTKYILSNPFYYGYFRYGGELHEGAHEPIIEKSLFDKA